MKRKGFRRCLALPLSAAMMLSVFSGSGAVFASDTDSIDKNDPAATAASNGIELPELPDGTLSLVISITDYQISSEDTYIQELWQEAMEAYLGCTLDITWIRTPQSDYSSTAKVNLQAGTISDVNTNVSGTYVTEYGEDGILLNLSDYMDYMVYYPDYLEDTNGGAAFAQNEDGSMYYFFDGFYNPDDIEGAQSFTSFAYRFDILQENGWTPATTLDEFTELCANIQAGIDDGSIDLDYVIIANTYSLYRGFVGIFHTWDCVYYNGEEWVYGPFEDNFREMLKYLYSLYEAGYIDPEFETDDYNTSIEKATTGGGGVMVSLWSGTVAAANAAMLEDSWQWGLAYLPENTDYGTAWRWGARQAGKSLSSSTGIYISADTEYPEYVVAMIDYQYSDYMVNLLNWGVEGETYTVDEDGTKTYIDEIMDADSPATTSAQYGLMSSSVCRTGIPFAPIDFNAMLAVASLPEPWWSEEQGYYEGKYWVETSVNGGGSEGVSPYDRGPVTYLSAEETSWVAELKYGGSCESRMKELVYQFWTGELDIYDDAAWEAYINDVKSQTDEDFDSILEVLNEKTVKAD